MDHPLCNERGNDRKMTDDVEKKRQHFSKETWFRLNEKLSHTKEYLTVRYHGIDENLLGFFPIGNEKALTLTKSF